MTILGASVGKGKSSAIHVPSLAKTVVDEHAFEKNSQCMLHIFLMMQTITSNMHSEDNSW